MAQTFDFEWDVRKALSNLRKHSVSFEQAAQVFLDPLAVTVYDDVHAVNEERWLTLGQNKTGGLIVVAHTYLATGSNSALIRIISARFATREERRAYSDGSQ